MTNLLLLAVTVQNQKVSLTGFCETNGTVKFETCLFKFFCIINNRLSKNQSRQKKMSILSLLKNLFAKSKARPFFYCRCKIFHKISFFKENKTLHLVLNFYNFKYLWRCFNHLWLIPSQQTEKSVLSRQRFYD